MKKGEFSTTGGITQTTIIPQKIYLSLKEYRNFVYNKTGFRPTYSDCVRTLLKEALIARNAYECTDDEEDSQ